MAVTITNITTPNSNLTEFSYGPFRARMVDVLFDSTYPTAGEIITAANLGWTSLVGGVVINDPAPSGLATSLRTRVVPNTALTQVKLQLMQSGYDPTNAYQLTAPSVTILADKNSTMLVAPFAGTVTACSYSAVAAITGAASPASRTFTLANLTATLTPAQLAAVGGVNFTQDVPKVITLGNAANVAVAAGDVLQWQSLHIGGTGLVDPGGLVSVTITPTLVNVELKELANNTDASSLTGRYLLFGY
jgi:hypothetical protein